MMTRILCTSLLILVFVSCVFSSDWDLDWGEVSESHRKLTAVPYDTLAAAVKLYDRGLLDINLNRKYAIYFKRHFQIKVLSKEGASAADITIPYWHKDKIRDLEAQTILPSGEELELDDDHIFDQDHEGLFRIKRFSLPQPVPGAVLEVQYELASRSIHELDPWYFQSTIPVLESRYTLELMPGLQYKTLTLSDAGTNISYDTEKYLSARYGSRYLERFIYTGKNLPAVSPEPYVACLKNHMARLDCQIVGFYTPRVNYTFIEDWATLVERVMDSRVGEFLEPSENVRTLVDTLLADSLSARQKICQLHGHIRDRIELDREIRYYYPQRDQDEILESKKASGAEKNLLLLSCLKACGFEPLPVLLSRRSQGKVDEKHSFLTQFNHAIVRVTVQRRPLLLDCSDPYLIHDRLPLSDYNGKALLLDVDNPRFISIKNNRLSSLSSLETDWKLDADGELRGTAEYISMGYACNEDCHVLETVSDWSEFFKEQLDPILPFDSIESDHPARPRVADTLEVTFEVESEAENLGSEILVTPPWVFAFEQNPFSNPERSYPVEFDCKSMDKEVFRLHLPEGYEVRECPRSTRISNTFFSYVRSFETDPEDPGTLVGERLFRLKRTEVPVRYYSSFREEFETLVDYDQEAIIIGPGTESESSL